MKHTLASLFGDSEPTLKAPMKSMERFPVQDDYEEVINLLTQIDKLFYTAPVSAAKRIAVGSRLRHVSVEVMGKLSADERASLMNFHATHRPLLGFLLEQRQKDRDEGSTTYLDYETTAALARHHSASQTARTIPQSQD